MALNKTVLKNLIESKITAIFAGSGVPVDFTGNPGQGIEALADAIITHLIDSGVSGSIAPELEYLNALGIYVGAPSGSIAPNYPSTIYVTNGDAITIAVGVLDNALSVVSGSVSPQDLDSVCDRGSVTDQGITVDTITASSSGSQLKDTLVDGDFQVSGNIIGNITDSTFGDITVDTIVALSSGSQLKDTLVNGDIQVDGDLLIDTLKSNGNVYINYDGLDADSYLYFYDGGSPTGAHLKWNETNDRFEFNGGVYIDWALATAENVIINVNNADRDAVVTFKKPTSGDETLRWDKTDTRFEFSDSLYVDGIIQVTTSGSSLKETSITGLDLVANKITNVTDPTNLQDAATKNYVDTVSGSIGSDIVDNFLQEEVDTLATVTGRGNTTGQPIFVTGLGVTGSIAVTGLVDGVDLFAWNTAIKTFTGQTDDADDSPSYTEENFISDGDSLELAVDKLDQSLNNVSGATGTQDLDSVCDIGSVTDQGITVDTIVALSSGSILQSLQVNEDIHAAGDIRVTNLYASLNITGDELSVGSAAIGGNCGVGNILTANSAVITNELTVGDYLDVTGTITAGTSGSSLKDTLVDGQLQVGGDLKIDALKSDGNIYINYDGPNGPGYLYFYSGGSPTGEYIQWRGPAQTNFYISNNLNLNGCLTFEDENPGIRVQSADDRILGMQTIGGGGFTLLVDGTIQATTSGSSLKDTTIEGDLAVVGSIRGANVELYANTEHIKLWTPANQGMYFDTGDYFYWRGTDTAGERMKLDANTGALSINGAPLASPVPCQITSHAPSGEGGLAVVADTDTYCGLLLSNADQGKHWLFSHRKSSDDHDLQIYFNDGDWHGPHLTIDVDGTTTIGGDLTAANLKSNGNIYINFDGPDGDSYLYFYDAGSPTARYLRWDVGDGEFIFSYPFKGPELKVGAWWAADYTEIKADGEINLHGTARVKNHIRVGAHSWKPGVFAPSPGYAGIFPTLDFDKTTDDSVYYELIVPYRMAAGTTINVEVFWTYAGGQDNGTVCWTLEYKNVAIGEVLAGGTSSIFKVSAGTHTTDTLVSTTLTTGITGAVARDALGLRLYRDASDDTLNTDARLVAVHFHFITDKLGQAT